MGTCADQQLYQTQVPCSNNNVNHQKDKASLAAARLGSQQRHGLPCIIDDLSGMRHSERKYPAAAHDAKGPEYEPEQGAPGGPNRPA